MQYEGVIPEHRAVRTDCRRLRRLAHGRARGRGPARARPPAGHALERPRPLEPGQAQYTLLTNEHGGIVDDLIVYRLGQCSLPPGRQRLEPRGRLRVAEGARDPGLGRAGRLRRVRAARRAGADARSSGSGSAGARRSRSPRATIDGVEVMVNRTGYTGEHGVELMCMAEDAVRLWDRGRRARRRPLWARRARHAAARGLLPAARQRHRARDRRDLGGPRLGLRARQGVHGRRGPAPRQGGRPGAAARRVRDGGEGDPAAGHADRRRRRGHVRLALADARRRASAWATSRPRAAQPDTELTIDVRGQPGRARVVKKPIYKREGLSGSRRELSRRPEVPPRARLGPDRGRRGVLGITWFAAGRARRARPLRAARRRARRSRRTQSYGEVESVKAVSDLIAPLSGEVLEVNAQVVDAPETVNEDPVRRGLARPHPARGPGRGRRAARRRRLPATPRRRLGPAGRIRFLVPDRAGPRADARDDRRRLDRRALRADARRRPLRPGARPRAGAVRAGARRAPRELAARNADTAASSRSSAPASTTTTFRPSSTRCSSAASS